MSDDIAPELPPPPPRRRGRARPAAAASGPRRRRGRGLGRIGVLLLGLLVGFAVTASILLWYINRTRTRVVEEEVRVRLGLPADAFELEKIEEDGSLRVVLRQVAFLDKAGDTIVSAPLARGRLIARTMTGKGAIVVDDVELIRPNARLLQRANGEWNFFDIIKAEAAGQPLNAPGADEEVSRPLDFRGMRIVDGRVRIARPYVTGPAPTGRFASTKQPERARFGGRTYTIHTLTDVDATLPLVRVGPNGGWRTEITSLTANVRNPDTRIQAFAGLVQADPDKTIHFDITRLRTPHSSFDGEGRVLFADAGPVFDLNIRANPLGFADLQGMGFPVPATGTAAFRLAARTQSGGRTVWNVSAARVAILDSRAAGRLTVITAPDQELRFTDTRITLDPLRLRDMEALGYVDELPLLGTVRGEIASLDVLSAGEGGPLRLDLTADLTPRDAPGAEPSVLAAAGLVRFRPGAEEPLRFQDLRVDARPLRLEHLAALSDTVNPLLRGLISGGATISGSPTNLRIEGGELVYKVGDAPETVLAGLSGTVRNGDVLQYELRARAQPLALATLTELFPSLPFRRATLAGPISVSGNGDDVRFDIDLQGSAGGIAMAGSVRMGEPMRFDVQGRLEAFRAATLVTGNIPVDGPLSGTFSARGTTEDLRFAVDMRQGANGSFALGGTVRRPGGTGSPQFDIAGRVDEFRIGALIGRPGLLPGPVSGPIAVSGGGRQPYRFDVALTGQMGGVDVRGTFAPGDVPEYAVTGSVRNLDLSGLPGFTDLPGTRLTGNLEVNGRGTTPETFAGRVAFTTLPGTTVGGVTVERGVVRVVSEAGVLRVDTMSLAVRGVRLEASGQLGLTNAAPEPLRFTLDAPNLGVLAAFIPPAGAFEPAIAGSLQASGWVRGTLRYPEIAAAVRGTGIQYQGYRAEQLAGNVNLAKGSTVWTGNVALNGQNLTVGGDTYRSLELQANLTPDAATFGVDLRRDENTDLHASGALELQGLSVNAVVLRELNLRLRDVQWALAVPQARLAMLEGGGYRVENLRLQRSGAATGFIEANGTLPATGTADLMIRVAGVDLAELRQLAPAMPDVAGIVTLNAAVTGPVERPRVLLDGLVEGLAFGGLKTDTLALNGEYVDRAMQLRATVRLDGRSILSADAAVPMTLTLGGLVPGFELLRTEPLRATLTADSLPMQLVAGALPTMLENGVGQAYAQVNVSGTLDDPTVAGTATLAGAAVTVVPLGVRWENMAATVHLQGDQITVDSAVAYTGGDGSLRVTGAVVLDQPGRPSIDLEIRANNFQAADRDDLASLQVNAGLRVGGRLPRADLSGQVEIQDGVIYIPETGAPTEADIVDVDVGELGADTVSAGVATAAGIMGMLVPNNLEVAIGENVRLQSSELSVYVATERPLVLYEGGGLPRVFGDVQTLRGTYTLSVGPIQRDFEISEGSVQFTGTPELNPRLDVNAVHQVRGSDPGAENLAVNIHLGGTLQAPTIALSSNTRPPLPESELLSLLLFGRRSADLASLPSEFTQGVILEQLLGGVITNQLEQVFTQLGFFDYVRLRARPTGVGFGGGVTAISTDILAFASVEAGKQLFEDFYVVLEIANIFSEPRPGASFEYQASRSWAIRGAFEPVRRDPLLLNLQRRAYQFSLEARRRWEYGRPKVTDADVLETIDPPASDVPAPGQMSTPTGAPPPTPPDPSPD